MTDRHMTGIDDVLDERGVVVREVAHVVLLVYPAFAVELLHARDRDLRGETGISEEHVQDPLRLFHGIRFRVVEWEDGLLAIELRELGAATAAAKLPAMIRALQSLRASLGIGRKAPIA